MSKNYVSVIFVTLVYISHISSIGLPSYIKACSLSDPNFEQCCLEQAKEALPFILKGDKKYRIPNLVPLKVPSVTVNASENLKIYLKDTEVFGLENVNFQKVKIDVKNQKLTIKANVPQLSLVGKYRVDGKILILPIQGNGNINITAVDGVYQYECDYTLKKVDGEEHLSITDNDVLDFKLGKATFKLDNLFNGDEVLGKQMNTFLNENWSDVISEIGGAISETVRAVVRVTADGIFSKISYRHLFLE